MSRKRSKIGKEKSKVYRKAYLSMSLKVFSGTLVQQSIHSSSLCAAVTESAMFDVDEDMNPVAVFRWLGRKWREHRLVDNTTCTHAYTLHHVSTFHTILYIKYWLLPSLFICMFHYATYISVFTQVLFHLNPHQSLILRHMWRKELNHSVMKLFQWFLRGFLQGLHMLPVNQTWVYAIFAFLYMQV